MKWTLEDLKKLRMPQYIWIVKSLEKQKRMEARALRGKK